MSFSDELKLYEIINLYYLQTCSKFKILPKALELSNVLNETETFLGIILPLGQVNESSVKYYWFTVLILDE